MKCSVVAFDVIGTLFSLDALKPALREIGLAESDLTLWFSRLLAGAFALTMTGSYQPFQQVATSSLQALSAERKTPASAAAVERVVEVFQRLTPYPDVRPAMQQLQKANVRIVALTNGSAQSTQKLLQGGGLAGTVEQVISAEAVRQWKPAAQVYRHAAEACGVSPGEICLIAAHPWDLQGAKRAGLQSGFVQRQETMPPGMFEAPDVVGHSLTEVVEQLLNQPLRTPPG